MIIEPQELKDVLLLKPKVFSDNRGYFFESFKYSIFEEIGLNLKFVQDNEVYSSNAETLRGLHYQLGRPQGKLIHVVKGSIKDVIIDIRIGSPDFGKSMMVFLDSQLHNMVYVPEGFAHGYVALESNTIVQYKCTNYYDPTSEYGILWNDKDLNINWGVSNPVLSEKDRSHPRLKDQKDLPKIP